MFTLALFITKIQKQDECLSEAECIKKMCYVCTREYYSVIKEEHSVMINLKDIVLSQTSQAQKVKGFMISLIYAI